MAERAAAPEGPHRPIGASDPPERLEDEADNAGQVTGIVIIEVTDHH